MDTDELMSAVPVHPLGEPTASHIEVDAAALGSPQHHGDMAPEADVAVDVHAQLSDVEDVDDDGHAADALKVDDSDASTLSEQDPVANPVNADPDPETTVQSAVDVQDVDMAEAVDAATDDVAGVDAAVGDQQVGVGDSDVGVGVGDSEAGVGVGDPVVGVGVGEGGDVEVDASDDDYDDDEDSSGHDGDVLDASVGMSGSESHVGDATAHADVSMVGAAIPQTIQPAEPSVEATETTETMEARSRSGSNGSANGSASARSVGRLRVNDKGEPTMMLPSFIWDYFVKEANGKFVVCTLCPNNVTRFAYSGGTSTMNRHLRKKHQKYAPGKSAADYSRPRAAKRALAAAMANGTSVVVASRTHANVGVDVSAASVAPSAATVAAAAAAVAASVGAMASSPGISSPSSSSHHHHQNHDASTGGASSSSALSMGQLSPSETTRRQLIELRNARRRATTAKRRKLIHGMLDTDQYTIAAATATTTVPLAASTPTAVVQQAEFDPSGFVTLHTPSAVGVVSAGGGLQFPPGFELSDASGMDASAVGAAGAGGDVRLFDYAPTTLLSSAMANSLLASGGVNSAVMTPLYAAPRNSSSRRNPQQHKLLTHRLLKYLIAQYEPLDVSRMGAELGALVSGTDYPNHLPNTKFLPSEETLKLALANLYYSQREMLKEVIAEVDVLSLSLNNWKSVFGQNVLTVSGHWISQGFSRRDCVLEVYVLPLDESVNTIALLRDVMDKWDIPANKVAALTMLKNGKEDKAIHEEYPGLTVVNCFVNVLDNAVSAGLMKCAPLIRRCRNYVSYFIQNPSEYQIFLSLQRKVAEANLGINGDASGGDVGAGNDDDDGVEGKASTDSPKLSPNGGGHHNSNGSNGGTAGGTSGLPLPALSVICDFEDRWNSTSEMICRIVELEQMLMLYKSNLESDTNPNRRPMQLRFVCCELSSDEWANLKELARLLEPIEGVVHVATNCEYPGLSIILPLMHSIRKHLDAAELWIATSLASAVRNSISSALAAAQPLCSCGAMPPASPYLSCLLDPRFKALPFLDRSEREQLIEMLKVLHVELVDSAGGGDKDNSIDHHDKKAKIAAAAAALGLSHNSGVAGKKGGILNAFFPVPEAHDPASELFEKLKAHVQLYLDSPSLPATDDRENDPLDWWSRYVRSFPWLAKLAKKYLCMSAVSVPFYEAFTNYGQLMREKKARLDIEVAAQILFCRSVSRIPEMERMNV